MFTFLRERIEEVPGFLFIIQKKLCTLTRIVFTDGDKHTCCVQVFLSSAEEQECKDLFAELSEELRGALCTCTPYDLCV